MWNITILFFILKFLTFSGVFPDIMGIPDAYSLIHRSLYLNCFSCNSLISRIRIQTQSQQLYNSHYSKNPCISHTFCVYCFYTNYPGSYHPFFILPRRESIFRFSDQKFMAIRPDIQGLNALQQKSKFLRIYWKYWKVWQTSLRQNETTGIMPPCFSCFILPSLTVERVKRGYKPSKYGRCSLFRSCIDMCYILSLSKTFVFLMSVRIEVLVIIS